MANSPTTLQLYELLPAVYRERDAKEGYPLRALLDIIQQQAQVVHSDIQQLWDNFFIETCDPWVIPYIGDLVGNNTLYDADRLGADTTARELFEDLTGPDLRPDIAVRSRADVAKTIYYRRRKGTLPMLEELARDVTGWASHAVEFFQLLTWTQNLNHVRAASKDCVDIRKVEAVERVHAPFDIWSHSADVRAPEQTQGWYNIPNIGFFLWRLRSYSMQSVTAREGAEAWQYYFSPLGNSAPLFNRWRREGDEAGLAGEYHVPGPIRPAFFYEDLEAHRYLTTPPTKTDLYGLGESVYIEHNGNQVVPPNDNAVVDPQRPQILCRRLDPWPASQPTGAFIWVDVASGRMAIGDGCESPTTNVDVWYHYGFSADLGGGPYERGKWLVDGTLAELNLIVQQDATPPGAFSTLNDALTEWVNQGRPNTVITILDNRSYFESLTIELADDAWLAIEAATQVRPHIRPNGGAIVVTGDHAESVLSLSGLLIEGGVEVEGDLGRLRLLHSTLVPGRALDENGDPVSTDASLIVSGDSSGTPINTDLQVQIAFSILGPIRIPSHATALWALDSIIDGLGGTAVAATGTTDQPTCAATLERVTIFGASYFKKLPLASEAIFTARVFSEQRHEGCVRFSFVPEGSTTPRRYRCQPDLQIKEALDDAKREAQAKGLTLDASDLDAIENEVISWLVPSFTSERYADPGYAQLRINSPLQIRTGAEDGSEMGAFCHLKQPQRETNLRIRLDEYLPFGLVPGLIYVT